MSESEYVNASGAGDDICAVVYVYPTVDLNERGPEVDALIDALQARVVPGMRVNGGRSSHTAASKRPLVIITFTLDLIPLPLEDVLEWLRDQPLVRVIEIDRFRDRDPAPDER